MTPKVPDSYLKARRDQIIEAACSTFVKKGLDKTTMPDIFEAARLSPGAVYNYFPSKEDIIEACAAKSLEENTKMISEATSAEGGNPLISVMRAFFPTLKQEGAVKAIGFDLDLYAESTRNPHIADILKANNNALLEQFKLLVHQQQQEGKLNAGLDPTAMSRFLIGTFYGLLMNLVMDPHMDVDAYMSVCESVIKGEFTGREN